MSEAVDSTTEIALRPYGYDNNLESFLQLIHENRPTYAEKDLDIINNSLESVLEIGTGLNAKARRKIRRFIDTQNNSTVSNAINTGGKVIDWSIDKTASITEARKESIVTTTLATDKKEQHEIVVPFDASIVSQSCTSLEQLELVLSMVKPNEGNCTTRRKLRRYITHAIQKDEIKPLLNAKTNRKISRALKFLEPVANAHKNTVACTVEEPKVVQKVQKEIIVPNILFFGQLSFDTTIESIQNFLSESGINGVVSIRLLTDSNSGKSKGMAFVEVNSPVEMHKCLALHRSIVDGRRINIEKSCGGKQLDSKTNKINKFREDQNQKLADSNLRIIKEHEIAGVLNFNSLGSSFREELLGCATTTLELVSYANVVILFSNYVN